MGQKHHVFVYGSLLSGLHNNDHLKGQLRVGEAQTNEKFIMLSFGAYPGLIDPIETEEGTSIVGELWSVDEDGLKLLDHLECIPDLYDRRQIGLMITDGDLRGSKTSAWCYFYVGGEELRHLQAVPDGDWRKYID